MKNYFYLGFAFSAIGVMMAGCVMNNASDNDAEIPVVFEEALSEDAPQQEEVASDVVVKDAPPVSGAERGLPIISGRYDLVSVINIAITNNLALREAFLRRDEARGGIVSAKAAALPQLSLGAAITSDIVERGDNPDVYGASLSFSQPLWSSGAISAGLSYAELYASGVEEDIRSQMQDVVAKVSDDYLRVLLSMKMVNVYRESLAVAERMLDTANKKRNAGTASDYEVLRAEVEVASSKADLIKEENNLRTMGMRLLQDMGVDQRSRISIVGALEYKAVTNDLTSSITTAMAYRPDVRRADLNVAMAKESLKIAESKFGPSIDLKASGRYQNPDPNDSKVDDWNYDASVGVELSYALFDGNERRGKLVQVESQKKQAEAALRSVVENARVEVESAILDIANADELFRSQAKNIDLSEEAIRMLENGFKVGRNTQIEVLDAHSALTEAKGLYYEAIYSHAIAKINLRKAEGTLCVGSADASPMSEVK